MPIFSANEHRTDESRTPMHRESVASLQAVTAGIVQENACPFAMHCPRQPIQRVLPLERLVDHADYLADGIDEIVLLGPVNLQPALRQMLRKHLTVEASSPVIRLLTRK